MRSLRTHVLPRPARARKRPEQIPRAWVYVALSARDDGLNRRGIGLPEISVGHDLGEDLLRRAELLGARHEGLLLRGGIHDRGRRHRVAIVLELYQVAPARQAHAR